MFISHESPRWRQGINGSANVRSVSTYAPLARSAQKSISRVNKYTSYQFNGRVRNVAQCRHEKVAGGLSFREFHVNLILASHDIVYIDECCHIIRAIDAATILAASRDDRLRHSIDTTTRYGIIKAFASLLAQSCSRACAYNCTIIYQRRQCHSLTAK